MIEIIIKAILILSGVSAIMLYLLILGANKNKSEFDKKRDIEEELKYWDQYQK